MRGYHGSWANEEGKMAVRAKMVEGEGEGKTSVGRWQGGVRPQFGEGEGQDSRSESG